MDFDKDAKDAVQNLSDAINSAVEQSFAVRIAIEKLRELGFEPNLMIKLEIGLEKIAETDEDFSQTAEDVNTLRRMKIKF